MRLGVDMKSLLSARQATQGDMESRKLYWIVLSGIALILLAIALGPGVRHAEAQAAVEPGLAATYYNNKNLTAPTLTRTDPQINFSWGKGSPSRRIDPDNLLCALDRASPSAEQRHIHLLHVHERRG